MAQSIGRALVSFGIAESLAFRKSLFVSYLN